MSRQGKWKRSKFTVWKQNPLWIRPSVSPAGDCWWRSLSTGSLAGRLLTTSIKRWRVGSMYSQASTSKLSLYASWASVIGGIENWPPGSWGRIKKDISEKIYSWCSERESAQIAPDGLTTHQGDQRFKAEQAPRNNPNSKSRSRTPGYKQSRKEEIPYSQSCSM